jgi:transposase
MTITTPEDRRVIGGVDTHADTHCAAALDGVGRLLGTWFPAVPAANTDLVRWLAGFGAPALVGVEGTSSYGAGLTRHLRSQGSTVVEVNRPDRRTRAVRGKSEPIDAENAARRALAGQDCATPKDTTTVVESVRALTVARCGAVKARTAALNQVRDLLTTAPEPLRSTFRGMSLKRVAAAGARLRPDPARLADPLMAAKTAMRSIGRRVQALTEEITELDRQLAGLLEQAAPRTTALFAISTQHAAQLLITAGGNPDRLASEASFAPSGAGAASVSMGDARSD